MTKKLSWLLAALAAAMFAVPAGAWEVDIEWQIGQLFFEEELTHVYVDEDIMWGFLDTETTKMEQDWDAYVTKIVLTGGDYDFNEVEGGIEFGLFVTENHEEQNNIDYLWTVEDLWFGGVNVVDEYQETVFENLDIKGFDFHGEIGYGAMLQPDLGLAGLVGYGYRRVELDRSEEGLPFWRALWDSGNNDTFYDIHYIDFTLRSCYQVSEDVRILVEKSIGPVVASKRSQDGIESIRGEGGLMARVEAGVDWQVRDNIRVFGGAFYDVQWLNGGKATILEWEDPGIEIGSETLEWDDHAIDVVGGTVGVELWL